MLQARHYRNAVRFNLRGEIRERARLFFQSALENGYRCCEHELE